MWPSSRETNTGFSECVDRQAPWSAVDIPPQFVVQSPPLSSDFVQSFPLEPDATGDNLPELRHRAGLPTEAEPRRFMKCVWIVDNKPGAASLPEDYDLSWRVDHLS